LLLAWSSCFGTGLHLCGNTLVDGSGNKEDTRRQYVSQLVSEQILLTSKDTAMMGMQS